MMRIGMLGALPLLALATPLCAQTVEVVSPAAITASR
jgi:hypothetical protein